MLIEEKMYFNAILIAIDLRFFEHSTTEFLIKLVFFMQSDASELVWCVVVTT